MEPKVQLYSNGRMVAELPASQALDQARPDYKTYSEYYGGHGFQVKRVGDWSKVASLATGLNEDGTRGQANDAASQFARGERPQGMINAGEQLGGTAGLTRTVSADSQAPNGQAIATGPITLTSPYSPPVTANTPGDVDRYIKDGYTPVHSDGTPYKIEPFMGGTLLDGQPINYVLTGQYMAGQEEALATRRQMASGSDNINMGVGPPRVPSATSTTQPFNPSLQYKDSLGGAARGDVNTQYGGAANNPANQNLQPLELVDPRTGERKTLTFGEELNQALNSGWRPIDSAGNTFEMRQVNGGWVAATDQGWQPLNRVMGGDWQDGQEAALKQATTSVGGAAPALPTIQSSTSPGPSGTPGVTNSMNIPGTENGFGSLAQGWDTPFTGESVYQSKQYDKTFDPGAKFSYTAEDLLKDPGYKFRMEEGQKALERSAAAKGGLFSGGLLKDIANYSQGLASQEFNQGYNRAENTANTEYNKNLGQFNLDKSIFDSNEAARASDYTRGTGEYTMAHDIFKGNQTDLFNRLTSLSGGGQTAATTLGGAASQYASNAGSIGINNATRTGDLGVSSAGTQGSGYLAAGNNRANAANNAAGTYQDFLAWQKFMGGR